MRQLAVWIVGAGFLVVLLGCGPEGRASDSPEAAERAVREVFDALARGEAAPLCDAQDLREHLATWPASARGSTSFEELARRFKARCAERATETYVVGRSTHQVVGTYQDAGRTVVKVRFRPHPGAGWVEWDLPCRHINGHWRMGPEGLREILGDRPGSPQAVLRADPPAQPSQLPPGLPAAEAPTTTHPAKSPIEEPANAPPRPAVSDAERKAVADLRRFLSEGGDVNEILHISMLLRWPARNVTRLHLAAERGWTTLATYLVEQGANMEAIANTKSHYNQVTPIEVARHAGHADLAALLEQSEAALKGRVRTLALDFPDPGNAAALVAFDLDRIRVAPEDMVGERVEDDLFIEPSDPEIVAITKNFAGLKHIGEDPAVASVEGAFDSPHPIAPDSAGWRRKVSPDSIRPGGVFLVRSGTGRIYKVEIRQCDTVRLVLRYARLPATATRPASTTPVEGRSSAADRQALRDVAQAFLRATQKGDAKAAAALCVGEASRALLEYEDDGEQHPTISEYDVRSVKVTGDRGVVKAWIRNEAFPKGRNEFALDLALRRVRQVWRIEAVDMGPDWTPEDLGREVVR